MSSIISSSSLNSNTRWIRTSSIRFRMINFRQLYSQGRFDLWFTLELEGKSFPIRNILHVIYF